MGNENKTGFKNVKAGWRFKLIYFLSDCAKEVLLYVLVENDVAVVFNKLACGV